MTEMMLKYHGCEAKKEEEEDNGFDCPECGKKYWSQKMLDIHKKVSRTLFLNILQISPSIFSNWRILEKQHFSRWFRCLASLGHFILQQLIEIFQTHLKFDDDDDLTNDILNMKIEMPKLKTKVEIEGPPDDDLLVSSKIAIFVGQNYFQICDDCDQTFTSAVLFRIHKRAHENEHKYVLGKTRFSI